MPPGGIRARRHLLDDDFRQLELARHDRGDLRERRVLDDRDRREQRIRACAAA